MKMREIIAHYHIFKNAGTTFDALLEQNFGDGFCDHRDDESMRKGRGGYLKNYLLEHGHLSAISSHHMCCPLPDIDNVRFHPVIFLRHPIERAASVYHFEKAQQAETPGAIHAKKYKFREYIEWRMDLNVAGVIRDYQTKTILGKTGRPKLKLDRADAEKAIAELRSNYLAGCVENFDNSLSQFAEKLGGYFPRFNVDYQARNVNSQNIKMPLSEKLDAIKDELADIYDRLVEANQCDLLVWQYANDRTQ